MTVPGGGCRSLGCRGYLCALFDARISFGTTTCFHRHLPQAHLLPMSLIKFHVINGQQCYWFVYTGHRHPHTTKLVQKHLKTERHLQIKVQRVPLIQDAKWGKLLATAPKIVCLNVWILQAVIWAKFHSHLDMREASVSHLTAVTVRATVNCHGYRGIRQVILFHPAWKADLVGGIIRVVLHVMLHTVFLHFLFLFHCLERKSLTYLFCSTIMLHIVVA